jgi:ferredoxin/flavodoxin
MSMEIERLKLVYFSPTGTTRKVVEEIARGLAYDNTERVDITSQAERKRPVITPGNELLVVGAPVYFGRVQTETIQFLSTMQASGTPAVCVVVYGNRAFDDALLELKETVAGRGCVPVACGAYIGEHSFSNPQAPIAVGRPDAEDLGHAAAFGKKIREKIASVPSVDRLIEITVPGQHPFTDMTENRKKLSEAAHIEVDKNTCLRCGECAQHCPVMAIDSEDSGVVDRDKCILCHACVKSCPAGARQIQGEMVKNARLRLSSTLQDRKEPVFFI